MEASSSGLDGHSTLHLIHLKREVWLVPLPSCWRCSSRRSYRCEQRARVLFADTSREICRMSGHAIHVTIDGRKHAGTFTVDRKQLTVTTTFGRKTAEVDPKVQHQVLAHQLLEQLVLEEKARKGSTI
jgi:hypothetical protein